MSTTSTSAVSAEILMRISLHVVGSDHVLGGSETYFWGDGIRRLPVGLDIGIGELPLARQLGYQALIAHHPVGPPHSGGTVFELTSVLWSRLACLGTRRRAMEDASRLH